jgi:hypothetical protein
MDEKFTAEDQEQADKLTLWLHECVERVGPVKTRWLLEVMLDFDFTRLPLKSSGENDKGGAE